MQMRGSFQIRLSTSGQPHGSGISVHEEDNYGLLVSPPQVSLTSIVHPVRLYTELYDFSPFKLGSLRIHGNKILAVVVDVCQEPPCKPEWVRMALKHIFEYTQRIQAPALSLPLLGHCHGGLQVDTCLQLILQALLEHRATLPPCVTLHMDRQHMAQAQWLLTQAGLVENTIYQLFKN